MYLKFDQICVLVRKNILNFNQNTIFVMALLATKYTNIFF